MITRRPAAGPRAPSFEDWIFWWSYNKDEFLNLKAALRKVEGAISTRSSTTFFGPGSERNRKAIDAPTLLTIRNVIEPALRKVIANREVHGDIRGGAVIALARCNPGPRYLDEFFALAKHGAGEDRLVQESALLALGILQQKDPAVLHFLADFLDEMDAPWRARCFAAFSLGLLGESTPEVRDALRRRLDGRESMLDLRVAAITALGLLRDAGMQEEMTGWLSSGRIGREKLGDVERAHLVTAVARLEDPRSLADLTPLLRRAGSHMVRSVAVACGQLVPTLPEESAQMLAVANLRSFVANERDATARNFALMSLGRIGNHPSVSPAVREKCLAVLEERYDKGGKVTERPWAALAMGVLAFSPDRRSAAAPTELRYRIGARLREDLAPLRGDPRALAAHAIALGLVGDPAGETVKLLIDILEERGHNPQLRGAAALALGLIGTPDAKEPILNALRERKDRRLRVDTAIAAGLLHDGEAITILVNLLSDNKASQFVLGSVALALGQIGDHRAAGALTEILEPGAENGAYPVLTRALVAVALGQLADQRDHRVLYRLSKDINYRASVAALDEVLTIL